MTDQNNPLTVALTGASGVVYGVRALDVLNTLKVPVHLMVSQAAALNLEIETDYRIDHSVGKALDLFGVTHSLFRRWGGE